MSGNQYFTRVYNNVNGPAVVQQSQVEGGQALLKELVGYVVPTATGTYSLLNSVGGTPITLPAGSYVRGVVYESNPALAPTGSTFQAGSSASVNGSIANAFTASVTSVLANAGNAPALSTTAAPAISSSAPYVSVLVDTAAVTSGTLKTTVLYV